MRALLVLLAMTTIAHADRGYFVRDGGGAAGFRGGLRAYGAGTILGGGGLSYRNDDRVYSLDVWGGWSEANADGSISGGSYVTLGLDYKRLWDIVDSRSQRLGVQLGLHGGPRYYWGSDALFGYDGPGLRAGASLEANLWVVGMIVDVGVDAMVLRMPVDNVSGIAPYVLVGAKMGWL